MPTVESKLAGYRRRTREAAEPRFAALGRFLGNLWLGACCLMWLWLAKIVVLGLVGVIL